jgi:ribosomal protein S19E (S16A)
MREPFIAIGLNIQLGAKGALVRLRFGSGIDQGALRPRKRRGFRFVFDEILANFRTDEFEQKAHVSQNRVIAQNGMVCLQQIMNAYCRQQSKNN